MNAQSRALEITINAAGSRLGDPHAALLALCRLLAAQIDGAGPDASTRLTAAYLSALKDLQRAIGGQRGKHQNGRLAQLRATHHETAGGRGSGP